MQAALSTINWSKVTRVLPWLGAAILIAGIVVFLINRTHRIDAKENSANKAAAASYKPQRQPKTVPLDRAARLAAGRFVIDAVQRKNLAEAWKLSGSEIRGGMTYKEWMTGDIPVIPFPDKIVSAPLKIDISTKNHALVEVALVSAHPKKVPGGVYWLEMRAIGAGKNRHWVVVSWVPRYAPPIPSNPGQ
jgi:hypothetical protein